MRKVTAAVILKDGKFFIAKRKEGGSLGGKWEFPGGKLEPDETPEEGLVREILEELDVRIQVGAFIGSHRFTNNENEYELLAFRADLSDDYRSMVLSVHDEIRWIAFEEFEDYDFAPSDLAIIDILKNEFFPYPVQDEI